MPTYAFISPKGGVGKTTSSLIFATQIAKRGVGVFIIDANSNYPNIRKKKVNVKSIKSKNSC